VKNLLKLNAQRIARTILATPDAFAILDTETSGLDGEAMEVAVIDPMGVELFRAFRHPIAVVHPKALAVHGLTPEVLDKNGARPWAEWHSELRTVLNGRCLVAYNVPFDKRILENTARVEGTESVLSGIKGEVCLMRLWSGFIGVKKWQGLDGDHSALGDCRAALKRVEAMALE
jgi:DNA polymerase-3 subunit epsilon